MSIFFSGCLVIMLHGSPNFSLQSSELLSLVQEKIECNQSFYIVLCTIFRTVILVFSASPVAPKFFLSSQPRRCTINISRCCFCIFPGQACVNRKRNSCNRQPPIHHYAVLQLSVRHSTVFHHGLLCWRRILSHHPESA